MTFAVPRPGPAYTVVYDGGCKICRRSVLTLSKWDVRNALEIIPSQSLDIAQRFPWIAPHAFQESIHVIRGSDNETWQGAAAVEQLTKILPHAKGFSWLFALPFARPIAEKAYHWFAGNRYRFGCTDHCKVR
ncbi:MAG: DUF393 domain-containing protein [Gemmatimonadaceae bacterium]|nr:DUF393 domain-containing protein [Gemmatimonadaceae bacterium]